MLQFGPVRRLENESSVKSQYYNGQCNLISDSVLNGEISSSEEHCNSKFGIKSIIKKKDVQVHNNYKGEQI